MLRSCLELGNRFAETSDDLDRFVHRLGMPSDPKLALCVRSETEHFARLHGHDRVSFSARHPDHLVRLEGLDAARFEDVRVVAESKLAELVGSKGEQPAGLGQDGCVLVSA